MSAARARFKQIDVARALRGAAMAETSVSRVEIDPSGKIVMFIGGGALGSANEPNEWDEVLQRDKTPAR